MLCLDHAICSRDIKVTSYWSTNRLRIFQYFEFEFLFTFDNDKQREVVALDERDHVIIFLQRNDTILLQMGWTGLGIIKVLVGEG